ncbi:ribonuclease PH [Halalkalibacillus sediminis]|uniref:Ribonuclease PH n=1 Tax=Halalkalibacillus sediminis TaxID=2018042 RepID=A0A2I0QY25_9BACI|nr:ribonuclease PH [Halalkalibacillus sediminis]PKR79219.1 ribonuclease PH [Halalkalibacillus sediminis]
MRVDGRLNDQLRDIQVVTEFTKHPEGSVLITVGDTKVICNASVEKKVPPFMRGEGKGWITAEYAMLPRATDQRNIRESSKGKVSGRTMEIQRLIGRSLRSVIDLNKIGERTIWVDCDVIQADGGTRTASITGAFIAVALACGKLLQDELIEEMPIKHYLAATSVGVTEQGESILDLCYEEDSTAAVDMNIVMTDEQEFVELQGTGEEATFSPAQLSEMIELATKGIQELFSIQKESLGDIAEQIQS